jgi:hypothetical protein
MSEAQTHSGGVMEGQGSHNRNAIIPAGLNRLVVAQED